MVTFFKTLAGAICGPNPLVRNRLQRRENAENDCRCGSASAAADRRAAAKAREQQLAIEQKKTKQSELELAARERVLADARAAKEEETIREIAWQRYFKRSPRCENPGPTENLVACGNEYIRAKRVFDEGWQAGKFRNLTLTGQ
jgi:hypothetical protein